MKASSPRSSSAVGWRSTAYMLVVSACTSPSRLSTVAVPGIGTAVGVTGGVTGTGVATGVGVVVATGTSAGFSPPISSWTC